MHNLRLYTRCRGMWLMLVGRRGRQRRALQALEGKLSDSQTAQFRWWAWAQRKASHAAARVRSLLLQLMRRHSSRLADCSCIGAP